MPTRAILRWLLETVVYTITKIYAGTNAAANIQTPELGSAAWRVAYGLVVTDYTADERTIKTEVNVCTQFIYKYLQVSTSLGTTCMAQ
jgi:hypothetical protein